MRNVKKRSVVFAVFASIITAGIYYLYWYVVLTNDTNELAQTKTASGGKALLFTIITFGIYGLYWVYKLGEKAGEIKGSNGSGLVYLLLTLIGFEIISICLAQSAVNNAVATR